MVLRPQRLLRAGFRLRSQAVVRIRVQPRRCYATAPGVVDTGKLPLHGIRVLDMTRVLAGVSSA